MPLPSKPPTPPELSPAQLRLIRQLEHLPLEEWVSSLVVMFPDVFSSRSTSLPEPGTFTDRKARVDELCRRRKAGESLWHEGDLVQLPRTPRKPKH